MSEMIVRFHHDERGIARSWEEVGKLVRCKDCKWWNRYNEKMGYCHAAKHGYMSTHWDISIRRTYEEDFYCADAERGNPYEKK